MHLTAFDRLVKEFEAVQAVCAARDNVVENGAAYHVIAGKLNTSAQSYRAQRRAVKSVPGETPSIDVQSNSLAATNAERLAALASLRAKNYASEFTAMSEGRQIAQRDEASVDANTQFDRLKLIFK